MSETPAERFAASRNRAKHAGVRAFADSLSFPFDDFQLRACDAVEDGKSVLVAAPTGAGKTVVGEFAIRHAHGRNEKAFYTTPIKALSNQKFNELRAVYGEDAVGLLTGDTTINSDADIVVMTTEVLRNMIYAGSAALDRLGVVVLDEVHYLADKFRGSVWEEVIIHLDLRTAIVALSATVSNAEEFGDWLGEVRGNTDVIVSETRPVPLWPHVFMSEGIFDLYAPGVNPAQVGASPRLNPELDAIARRHRSLDTRNRHTRGGNRPARGGNRGRPRRSPPRFAVVEVLDANELLPAIFFVFSRAGCEDAVDQVRNAGVTLTSAAERDRIREIVEARCAALPAEDLGPLEFTNWRDHLELGLAAHHAGMIPLFKEVVEELFAVGLIKVVFATETLALGINMPARSVVLEKLVKWNGETHKDLTAGEYTQLTGRAGRRGIDVEGHAVVIEHPGFDVRGLGQLASRRTYPLVSSFQPSYNMTLNLVAQSGVLKAREVLEMSFAQFQADQAVVSQARRVKELGDSLEGFRDAVACDQGDFMEYAGLREKVNRLQKSQSQASSRERREATATTLQWLRRGAVVRILGGKHKGLAVVVAPDASEKPRPMVVTEDARSFRLSAAELHHGIEEVGELKLPKKIDARTARVRKDIAAKMRSQRGTLKPTDGGSRRGSRRAPATGDSKADEIDALRKQLGAHACHGCADREEHARWAERYFRALRDRDQFAGEISRATGSIPRLFDRRCEVLAELGYLTSVAGGFKPTASGTMLRTVYSENDLVIAECLREGAWDHLPVPALAAVVSTVVYGGRRDDENQTPHIPQGPNGPVGLAMRETARIWSRVDDLHSSHQLPASPAPQWGIVAPVYSWAAGKGLDSVLRGSSLAPGDMVRWCKQIIDVLDQIANSAPNDQLRQTATATIEAIRRGVVAY